MPRKAHGKPPASEWERHKENIVSLAAQYQWPVVIDRMEKEHGFLARNEHYVAQMKLWETRKNLKKHEWRVVLHRLDQLSNRHQRKIRVRLLGEVVSEEKIKRSRNRSGLQSNPAVPGTDQSQSIPAHVSFEVLGTDNEWSTCTNDLYDPESPQGKTLLRPAESSSQSIQRIRVEKDACATHEEQHLDLLGARSAHEMNSTILDLTLPHSFSFPRDGQEATWPLWSPISDHPLGPGLDVEWPTSFDFLNTITQNGTFNVNQHTTLTNGYSSADLLWDPTNILNFDPSLLNDLPFQQFRTIVAKRGIEFSSFRLERTWIQSYGTSFPVTAFLRDVAETESLLSNLPGPKKSPRDIKPKHPLLSFYSLLPGEPNNCQADLITKDEMLDTNFIRILLFSIANGFAGLGDIPLASILRFLTRCGNTDTLFLQVLRASPSHVAKSLAENLIKAAIEAQQSHIVKYLLDTQLLNVNDLVLEVMGQKLTAVERAAQLQDCKTVKVLLAQHANINKTYASDTEMSGPIILLIEALRPGETISTETWDLFDALLHHGAKVDVDMLKTVLKNGHNSTLALRLISHFLEINDTDPIRNGMLPLVALELEEKESYEAIKKMTSACRRLHNSGCLHAQEGKTEWALVQSAKRGHTRVVQLLLPYTKDLPRVLSASFHGGNSVIVDLVLVECPDLNAPVHIIDDEDWPWEDDHEFSCYPHRTTPLAEALRTRNAKWIQLCEDLGALQHLHLTGHFQAALAAAATIGDLQYVRKLLAHRLEPLPTEMYAALVASIEKDHEEIAFLLIAAGASLFLQRDAVGSPQPLFAAVRRRNARMVRMILDAGTEQMAIYRIYPTKDWARYSTVLAELIRWGDRSIILDVHRAFPTMTTKFGPLILESLTKLRLLDLGSQVMNKDFLAFLMDQGLVHEKTLSELLGAAIVEGDTAKIYHLLELGADPSDSRTLCLAVENYRRPDILAIILEHIPRRSRKVRGLGTLAINEAIRLGFPGLKMLDSLLASDVVDIHSMMAQIDISGIKSIQEPETSASPLGTAIKMADDFTSDFIVVKRLLKAGCDPNSVVVAYDDHNLTAILAAIQTKSVTLVQVLLEHGAEVNTEATMRRLRTPIQAATESGSLEMVQLLLKHNADINALPALRGGGTALQLAAISGNCNIVAELLKRGADVLMPPPSVRGRWPLEGAAEHGRLDMIGLLLRLNVYGVDHCERAAKFAEDNGHMGCRDLILEHISQAESMSQFAAPDLGSALDFMT